MANRRGFNFKDSYDVDAELKQQTWKAASMVSANDGEEEVSEQDKAQKQLEAAEEYAQTLTNVKWASVNKVVDRIVQLREEVVDVAEMCETTMDPEDSSDGGLLYNSMMGPLTISENEDGHKTLTVQKEDGITVEVTASAADRTVKEMLPDKSSVTLSHDDNILTEAFNDGLVSRLDRKQFLKTIQLSPTDGNILVQAVLSGPRKGHVTIQCLNGRCVVIDENGRRSERLASPRARRRSSMGRRSPHAKPPKGPPPASPDGSPRSSSRSRSGTETDFNIPSAVGINNGNNPLIKKRGSFFRQLTSEKLVVPARPDLVEDAGADDDKDDNGEVKIQWRCIRRLWIHSKPATLSGLCRHMEIGETVVQIRKIQKSVGRTWIEFIDKKDPKGKKAARYVATTSKIGLKTMIPIFNS